MALKTKTITVTPGHRSLNDDKNDPLRYRVERITNSVEFDPGALITKQQVEELCGAKDWNVTSRANSHLTRPCPGC